MRAIVRPFASRSGGPVVQTLLCFFFHAYDSNARRRKNMKRHRLKDIKKKKEKKNNEIKILLARRYRIYLYMRFDVLSSKCLRIFIVSQHRSLRSVPNRARYSSEPVVWRLSCISEPVAAGGLRGSSSACLRSLAGPPPCRPGCFSRKSPESVRSQKNVR
jgi:hypothetical protein